MVTENHQTSRVQDITKNMVAPVSALYHMKITVHWKHLEHRFAPIILHIDWQHYSWGQKSVSKHMRLCTLPYKLASPAAITS